MKSKFRNKAIGGAFWQVTSGAGHALVRFLASMILSRLLEPSDFGLFGMALLIYNIFQTVSASGMVTGLIVKQKPDYTDYSTCFWILFLLRLVLFFLLLIIAPYAANYFEIPSLTDIIRTVAVMYLITGFGAIPRSILVKNIEFKFLSIITFIGTFIESLTAVLLVYFTNLNYWALVIAMLMGGVIINLAIIIKSCWFPKFTFSFESYKYLLFYGINNMGSAIANFFKNNIDYLVISKLLGPGALGYYEFAYRVPHLIIEKVVMPAGQVMLPSLASIKNNNEEIARTYISAEKKIVSLVYPLLMGLFVVAPHFIEIVWGTKWLRIAVPMRILCVVAMISCSMQFTGTIFLTKEKPNLNFKFNLIDLTITIILILLLGKTGGVDGIAWGMLISRLSLFAFTFFAFRLLKASMGKFLYELVKIAALCLVTMSLVAICQHILIYLEIKTIVNLLISVSIGVVLYAYLYYSLFKDEYFKYREIISQVFLRKK